jgi:DNA-binding transcriptional LysR family regulator
VSQSELLVTLPRHQAELANRYLDNQLLPFPAQAVPMEMYLYWHANVAAEPANQWLRRIIGEVMAPGKLPQ